jgi:putative ABC transport system permease protein
LLSRVNLNDALKASGRGLSPTQRLRSVLVVAQVALTLVLLTASGLLFRSLMELQKVDLGFNPDRLVTMRVSLLESKYPERQKVAEFYQQLLTRVGALPGVESAAISSNPPLIKLADNWVSFQIDGRPPVQVGQMPTAKYAVISPEFFNTLQIPLKSGRTFNATDTREGLQVAIINEEFARRHFPNGDALGKRIKLSRTTREVVGIAGVVRHDSPENEEAEKLYVPHSQQSPGTVLLMARAKNDPTSIVRAVQQAVWEGDADAAVSTVRTMDEALAGLTSRQRFNTFLLVVFALVALALATLGLYSVMSYTVSQTTREIGIRMALGAQVTDILRLVIGQGLVMTVVGVSLGIVSALALTRLLRSLLFGVSATDPLTFMVVPLGLIVVALAACYFPARRASQVDPLISLRHE